MKTASEKEAAILAALPGTSKQVQQKTKLPQATVSKHLQRLMLRNKAYHSDWQHPAGRQAVMIFSAGPKPEGYTTPKRHSHTVAAQPAVMVAPAPKPKPAPVVVPVHEWDEQCEQQFGGSSNYRRTHPDPIPAPHPLMSMYGMRPDLVGNRVDEGWQGAKVDE